MNKKLNILYTIVTISFSVVALIYIGTIINYNQKSAELIKELKACREKSLEATNEATAVAERRVLALEIDRFHACNGIKACEYRYPAAQAAIKAAEEKAKEDANN